jgi:hypothetical protein
MEVSNRRAIEASNRTAIKFEAIGVVAAVDGRCYVHGSRRDSADFWSRAKIETP